VFLRSDDELRFDVLDHVAGDLLRLPAGTVDVEVDDGVVRLTGRVPRRTQATALAALAQQIDGVVAVESRLEWAIDPTRVKSLPAQPASRS
jgi:osmotically-inducible protein OsmY